MLTRLKLSDALLPVTQKPMSKKSSLLATAPRAVLTDECGEAVKQWLFYSKQLEEAKTFELALRQQIGSTLFPSPVEGVNRVIVELDGKATEIVLDHKINRALDETVLDTVMNELPPDSPYRQVGVLVAYAPKLVLKGLRSMPNDQRLIFSQALTEKAGTPALHINEIDEGHAPETAPAQPDWPATRSASCMTSEQRRHTIFRSSSAVKIVLGLGSRYSFLVG